MEASVKPVWTVDGIVLGYLALTACLACLVPQGNKLALLHLGLILIILYLRTLTRTKLAFLHELYSVFLVPALYLELNVLSGLSGGRMYDDKVMSWELAIFGGSTPASWLSEKFPWLWLSEFLHFCYLSYYPMILFVAYRFYRYTERELFRAYLWSVHASCFAIYSIQMFFPVMGPRPLFPPLAEHLQGPFWWLCHYLCGQGAANAAAFPSGHVTFAVLAILAVGRWDTKVYPYLLPVSLGLILCTVYGRFHYGVDALAGMLIGWIFYELGSKGRVERRG